MRAAGRSVREPHYRAVDPQMHPVSEESRFWGGTSERQSDLIIVLIAGKICNLAAEREIPPPGSGRVSKAWSC